MAVFLCAFAELTLMNLPVIALRPIPDALIGAFFFFDAALRVAMGFGEGA